MMRDEGGGLTRRPISLLILIAAAVAAFSFVAAPWFAFRGLREAAMTSDTQALGKLIDYAAVRAGLGPQLAPGLNETPPPVDVWHDPIGALKQVFQPPPAAPRDEVNAWLTPRALDALSNGRLPGVAPPERGGHPWPSVKYWSPDRCRIQVADPRTRTRPVNFTFERRGIFTWKLVRIVPPDPQVGGRGAGR
jgi:DUF2939 family protein